MTLPEWAMGPWTICLGRPERNRDVKWHSAPRNVGILVQALVSVSMPSLCLHDV